MGDNQFNENDTYSAYNIRKQYPKSQTWQDRWAPVEHRQFMRELTSRSPFVGTLLAAGIPLYDIFKRLGINAGGTGEMKTSRPSLNEMLQGWRGYGQGLGDLFQGEGNGKL